MNRFLNISLAIAVILLEGCGILLRKTSSVPESIAKEPQKLVAKLDALDKQKGISVAEAKKFLGVKSKTPCVKDLVAVEEKQKALYGNVTVVGTPKEMEEFRKWLGEHDIVVICFKINTRSLEGVMPHSATVLSEGPDFLAYIIFHNNKLTKVERPDNFHKSEKTVHYVTELLPQAISSGSKFR